MPFEIVTDSLTAQTSPKSPKFSIGPETFFFCIILFCMFFKKAYAPGGALGAAYHDDDVARVGSMRILQVEGGVLGFGQWVKIR